MREAVTGREAREVEVAGSSGSGGRGGPITGRGSSTGMLRVRGGRAAGGTMQPRKTWKKDQRIGYVQTQVRPRRFDRP